MDWRDRMVWYSICAIWWIGVATVVYFGWRIVAAVFR